MSPVIFYDRRYRFLMDHNELISKITLPNIFYVETESYFNKIDSILLSKLYSELSLFW